MPIHLPRRTFLRGLGGVTLALPTLDIMLDPHGRAYASGEALPRRFFIGFHGQSMGGDGDSVHNNYAPPAFGPNYALAQVTKPLQNYAGLQDHISIVSNLQAPWTNAGPGSWNVNFHDGAMPPLIDGISNPNDQRYCRGISGDQVVANAFAAASGGVNTSLQYQVQVSWYLGGNDGAYGHEILSYAEGGAPMYGETSPQQAYLAMVMNNPGAFDGGDPAEIAAAMRELARRKSVLDLLDGRMSELMKQLGTADKQRMQRHLDEIRALENRLDEDGGLVAACTKIPDPGQDPPIGSFSYDATGDGFDVSAAWSDETTRAKRFSDIIAMAYACGISQSVSMLYTMAQSHMNVYPITGGPGLEPLLSDQHEAGHTDGTTERVSRVLAWQFDLFCYLVDKLRSLPEGAGTVLDNTALMILYEGGHGYDPADGGQNRTHSTENMIVPVAGGAGGLVGGMHIDGGGRHPVCVTNTLMQAVGVDATLGEVTGTIPELLG